MNPQPGEVWLADLGLAGENATSRDRVTSGSKRATRSSVVRPVNDQNRLSPYEVPLPRLPYLDRVSVANVQGLGSIPTVRLERKLGQLPADILTKIRSALVFALDLEGAR